MPSELVVPKDLVPFIIPIVSPNMNWSSYLREGHTHVGERFNKSIDAGGMKLGQDESIIVGLTQFSTTEYLDVYKTIRTSEFSLQFLYFVFMCAYHSATINQIVLSSSLKGILHPDQSHWLIGGNLADWKEAIVRNCIKESTFEARYFMNCCYVLFQCNGYQNVWSNYGKTSQPDGTFIFRHKDV